VNVYGKIIVRKGTWPRRTKILVFLNQDSVNGPKLSGDVKIVARKNNDRTSSQKLGMGGQDLIVKVINGRWENPQGWDYKYWADKGFDALAAQYKDPDGQDHEWFWSANPVQNTQQTRRVPTSISKIHYTSLVDETNPELMRYAASWTILDQCGEPIAGAVTSIFDGATNDVESKPDRPGVCHDVALVEGYDREMRYAILPPTGEPQVLIFRGPAKPEPWKLTAQVLFTKPESGKYVHTVGLLVRKDKGKEVDPGRDLKGRWSCGKQAEDVTLTKGSTIVEVTIQEGEVKVPFNALLYDPFLTLDEPLILDGLPSKPQATAKVYTIEADLDSPHPVGGKFIVAGHVKVDGKPGSPECTISATESCVVEGRLGQVSPGADPDTYKLTPAAKGSFKLAVTTPSDDVTLTITAPDGTSVDVPMVKPK
jgi:hypothetical protein